ncbi:hypothetical protein WJX72_012559 [[Myrmecia] bisecta]|uniref:ubiquitinyl hydrolase 1 n=1 Tax=[Myrmecia] bisecta TaxID=41462 RepID=A0AAW1P5W3_9CHLO
MPAEVYHERQSRQLCLKHTLNNLLQHQAFTQRELDDLAFTLTNTRVPFLNPHRTVFLGNYDVNVLELALQQHGKELVWFDMRDTELRSLDLDQCWAIIVNVKSTGLLAQLFGGRHWFGLRRLNGFWYNLDSELKAPAMFGPALSAHVSADIPQPVVVGSQDGVAAALHFLRQTLAQPGAQLLLTEKGASFRICPVVLLTMKVVCVCALLALSFAVATAEPILPGQGFLPAGNLLTSDNSGPFDYSLLSQQANEIKAGIAAKQNFTDKDIIDFLVNVECLEGLFDTWGTFGNGFVGNLELGGPTPLGARKANLTEAVIPFMQEVALNEQGHALFTRHAGSKLPCPVIDFDGGFNALMAAAYGLGPNETILSRFGANFDAFKNDVNFVLSVLTLEELGATGNKGLIGLTTSPVLANGIAGLATSANSQATIERMLLWQMRNMTVEPFNETAQQVFARVSAYRDMMDGNQLVDQGLVNTDPRFIAVPYNFINIIPTDVRGLTLNRSPQQNINILTIGSPTGRGGFFPNGLLGAINTPAGYNLTANGTELLTPSIRRGTQVSPASIGTISPPLTGPSPANVFLLSVLVVFLGSFGHCQPFLPGQNLTPRGNILTVDAGGPYNFTLLSIQANEVRGGIAARDKYSDKDIVAFLTNVECLEGLFDTWGTFGRGFAGDLDRGGPKPKGARKANLTERTRPFMQEVALNEQGHALFTRHAGSDLPCPTLDFDGGFNQLLAYAYKLPKGETIEKKFGKPFDPFKNDVNFILSVLSLEELGATGNKGLAGLATNPVLANGITGLATSANSQATVQRFLLWQMRNETVEPFNETAQQVFARVSAARDDLDGPQLDDQGLVNTDPRFIAVPDGYLNLIPTDLQGLTFSRSPQQVIRIVTVGGKDDKGAFFPKGLSGKLKSSEGYDKLASGTDPFPKEPKLATQEKVKEAGKICPPITGPEPHEVPDMDQLTQATRYAAALDLGMYMWI